MITVSLHPRKKENLYSLLITKEFQLRKNNRGSFRRRAGKSRSREDIWTHVRHPGWVRFRKGVRGSLTAMVHSKSDLGDWKIFEAFMGFVRRYFHREVATISITFE